MNKYIVQTQRYQSVAVFDVRTDIVCTWLDDVHTGSGLVIGARVAVALQGSHHVRMIHLSGDPHRTAEVQGGFMNRGEALL